MIAQENIYQQQKSEAEELIRNRDNTKAISLLKQLQSLYPNEIWAFDQHAFIALRRQKHPAETAQVAEMGLRYNPDNISLKCLLAEALCRLPGEEVRAEQLLLELQNIVPKKDRIKLLSIYGYFLFHQKRIQEAKKIYQSILAEVPQDSRAQVELARIYRIEKKYESSLNILENNPHPQDPFWLREKGHCFLEQDKGLQAQDLFKQARKLVKRYFRHASQKKGFLRRLEPLEKSAQALNGNWKGCYDLGRKSASKRFSSQLMAHY